MLISLCGNEFLKNKFIKSIKETYKEKVLICDVFKIKFNTIIDTEKIKYKLLDECFGLESLRIARNKYQELVDDANNEKINKFINDNKDKIVVLKDNDILTKGFTNTSYFKNSDIKFYLKIL